MTISISTPRLTLLDLNLKYSSFQAVVSPLYTGGESAASNKLNSFLNYRHQGYHWKLSRPWLAFQGSTSHLSAHIMFGTISTRQIYQATQAKIETLKLENADQGLSPTSKSGFRNSFSLQAFVDRLRWRDSFTQRLYFHPNYGHHNRFPEFDRIYNLEPLTTRQNELFQAWQNGQTGFPLVDASMRQLMQTGWLNFRMRAMCATFLCINMGVPWQYGARHFMNYLVDGDMAIDSWQWQMQAGVTNPLSMIFRIYNPSKNLQEKDAELKFIKHWLPELQPYNLAQLVAGDYQGQTKYPKEVLDFKVTKAINGKVISQLRAQVRERIIAEKGLDLNAAKISQTVVQKYKQGQQKQYQKLQAEIRGKGLF